ncbi:MAG: DNA alkylation repair protein [Woeseiaceae bacterium]|nr:DNA alkylation repair protein [Woeseiaceae bacterium]
MPRNDATPTLRSIRAEFRPLGDAAIAEHSARFFKTGKGEYGEGDRFLGIRVPVTRKIARRFRNTSLRTTLALLKSAYHEERLLAVLMLVDMFERGDEETRARVIDAYLANTRYINNWDIVDSSAHKIVGAWLETRDRAALDVLAASESLWERRIAMMATYHFIRGGDFDDALRIAKQLLDDDEDLIHKVTGWMLREIGNRDRNALEAFLGRHYRDMPRTMLRYAIEKLPERRRRAYLDGRI